MMKRLVIFLLSVVLGVLILSGCGKKEDTSLQSTPQFSKDSEESTNTSSNEIEYSRFIFTANEGGSISKIDSKSNKVLETIKVDGSVHNVQVSPDGKLLGATVVPSSGHDGGHSGHSNVQNGKVLFFDTQTNEQLKEVEVGNHPAHIVFTGDGKYALVTNNEDHNVSVINLENYSIKQTIPTGKGPHGFRVSTDNQFAYIANMGENTVSVISLNSFSEEKKIEVGATPVTTAVTTDGKTLLATLHAENAVVLVDLESGDMTKLAVGKGPAQVFIQSDNQFAFIANQGSETSPSNSVTKIDLTTKEVVATIETGKGSHGVVTSPDNLFVYVTNMFEDTVSVIDNTSNKVIRTISVDKIPNGISITP
jgi:YVTN family beta-propeller protein